MIDILIRTDGNRDDGLGHVYRSLSLYREFKRAGRSPALWIPDVSLLNSIVCSENPTVHYLSADEKRDLINIKPDILITDLPPRQSQAALSGAAKDAAIFHVAIDDMGLADVQANVCLNPGIVIPENLPQRYISGGKYSIIDENYRDIAGVRVRKETQKILITMGGSDPNRLTDRILRAIKEIKGNRTITVVLGGAAHGPCGYEKEDYKLKIIRSTKNMAGLMAEADIAFISAGITLYEVASLGLPSIVIAQHPIQGKTGEEFRKKGAVKYLGVCDDVSDKDIKKGCFELFSDYDQRVSMSLAGQKIIDGRGTERVRKLIESCYHSWRDQNNV